MSTVIGGAMLPHAPQFFTMPETEDKAVVAHVREVAADIGRKLRALNPDLWIIFSNDHAEQFFHTTAPPFTIHVGGEASGEFAGRKFHWKIPSEIGFELVRQLYRQNFDPAFTSTAKIDYAIGIPLTHLGHTGPVLPIYVNAYLPPQPTMERCYAFGQAVARTVTALGLKTVILSSGGMSHFPGTDRYSNPELGWDRRVVEKLAAGNLKALIGFDETELDETGNIELRCWSVGRAQAGRGLDGSELASQLCVARLDRRRRPSESGRALSVNQTRTGGAHLGASWPCPRSQTARRISGGCRRIRRSFSAAAGTTRGLDQA